MKKTIKNKITLASVIVTTITVLLTFSVCLSIFHNLLKKNVIQSTEFGLTVAGNTITEEMNRLLSLPNWVNATSMMTSLLSKGESYSNALRLEAYNRFYEEYTNNQAREYISRFMIANNSGLYLQILKSTTDGTPFDYDRVLELPFYDTLINSKGISWVGIVNDPMSTYNKQIIPILRPVYSTYSADKIGWTYIAISSDLITDACNSYTVPSDSNLYITIADKTYIFDGVQLVESDVSYDVLKDISDNNVYKTTKTSIVRFADGRKCTLITCPLGPDGWYISQIMSDSELNAQRSASFFMLGLICVAIILLGFILTIYLNRTINAPVKLLLKKLKGVSSGDFSRSPEIESDDEFGNIGKGINDMSQNIESLLEKRIDDENHQRELEYQILQSQINPHFLYNTLNSIKWMATIQNATGIAEMTTALSRLLKNVSKGTEQMITLSEELALLKDYATIQHYRYGGVITINYKIDESLLDCIVPRFSLQPLVENAAFHGIEAKGSDGIITVSIQKSGNDMQLIVEDDGVGMSKELISAIMSGQENTSRKDSFRKIGVSNVHNRIKYAYREYAESMESGEFDPEKYGISIESEVGKYTRMTILVPIVRSIM
ncbi:MAG: sensor histidine kinase [Lachnospiraceae bacterium]|nr:sensor histidine kinase [Lachnospiraceae bacterium]